MPDLVQAHLFELICGAYAFAAGAYVFGWKILTLVLSIRKIVTNHHEHALTDIRHRLDRLEDH